MGREAGDEVGPSGLRVLHVAQADMCQNCWMYCPDIQQFQCCFSTPLQMPLSPFTNVPSCSGGSAFLACVSAPSFPSLSPSIPSSALTDSSLRRRPVPSLPSLPFPQAQSSLSTVWIESLGLVKSVFANLFTPCWLGLPIFLTRSPETPRQAFTGANHMNGYSSKRWELWFCKFHRLSAFHKCTGVPW